MTYGVSGRQVRLTVTCPDTGNTPAAEDIALALEKCAKMFRSSDLDQGVVDLVDDFGAKWVIHWSADFSARRYQADYGP